jgi:RNase P subunit RPR2
MAQQTAVDWLVNQVNSDCLNSTFIQPKLIDQAKQMEKENIAKAWDAGNYQYFCSKITNEDFDNGEEYYEENYKNKTTMAQQTAVFKLNGGLGALLCSKCRVIIKIGKDFTKEEKNAMKGYIKLPPQYCEKCKRIL